MSIYNSYRLNFAGGFLTNVDTANNSPSVSDPLTSMLRPDYAKLTDDEAIAKLQTLTSTGQLPAGWNFMGDHTTRFLNASVTSFGPPGAVGTAGTTVGLPVYIVGSRGAGAAVMVDVDPAGGGVATQIFIGGIQIGNDPGAVKILHDAVCYTYYMTPRHGGLPPPPQLSGFSSLGVWFQFTLPKSALPATAADPGVQQLLDAGRAAQGLVVRFIPFEVAPAMSVAAIAALFAQGDQAQNPASGYLIGTIAVWNDGELPTSPPGRLLSTTSVDADGDAVYAPVLADVDPRQSRLSFDLVNAIPKAGYRASATDVSAIGPNFDTGELRVEIRDGAAVVEQINFTPSPDQYWRYGGIVDFHVAPANAQLLVGSPIRLVGGAGPAGPYIWVEEPYRVESEQRGIYLGNPSAEQVVSLRISQYGAPPVAPFELQFSTQASSAVPDPKNVRFKVHGAEVLKLDLPAGATQATITICTDGQPGMSQVNIAAAGPAGATGAATFNAIVRAFPFDDYSAIINHAATVPIPWDLVYDEVLRYYYVLFPAMSLRIPLNRPEILTLPGVAQQIIARMQPALFHTTQFMPLTRGSSPGKLQLLEAFLKQGPVAAPAPMA